MPSYFEIPNLSESEPKLESTNIVQVHLDSSEELYKCHYIIYYQAHWSGRGLASCLPVGPVAAVGGRAGQV